ncbi:MAG: DUF1588 domain-containing protein [Gemmataceae bacterium]|nr:DUF1588 domain-containing protein [Gemmataceae bacterium]
MRSHLPRFLAACMFGLPAVAGAQEGKSVAFVDLARPFLQKHCVKCHGAQKQSGHFRVDELTADVGKDVDRWIAVRDQLRDGLMPPPEHPRPDNAQTRNVIAWVASQTGVVASRLPNQGNLVPHELLFGKATEPAGVTAARLWRLSPEAYLGFVHDVARGRVNGLVQPFSLVPERGIKDFAGLYAIDEPSAEILLRNSEAIVESQTGYTIKDGKFSTKNDTVRELVALMNPDKAATRADLEAAVQTQFRLAIGRAAGKDEVERFIALYERCRKTSDQAGAARTMLQAVLLRTDAMYRIELGKGPGNRAMLAPDEIARSISLALLDRRDQPLTKAAEKAELATREQIAAHVQRILDDPKIDKTKFLKFFREYFEYGKAMDVFKEKPKTFLHSPNVLVSDTDRLVKHVLKEDRDVLRTLLTTDLAFVNYTESNNNKERKLEAKPVVVVNPNNDKGKKAPEFVYGFDAWPKEQPARNPKRLGVLMQPSWLVAHGANFDNDPVRRGRWVRERLLGGAVPDLPIGVAAQVPDDKHRTFRDRLGVTRETKCWKCHQKMDDLGLPFEQFDHYGVFRTEELVLDIEATAKNVDKKGKSLGEVLKGAKLDTTGKISDSGDPALDGAVSDPHAFVRKLADSELVRQVFVRHAFRFFLGRNETLSDARTLQDADRAYVGSGGSFRALVKSLLTSDAFLYRAAPTVAQGDPR